MPDIRETLDETFRAEGWELAPGQLDLAVEHCGLLLDWNERTNLTRIIDLAEVARRHFIESFIAASLFPASEPRVLDVGAGGGFPGLAALIVRPDLRLTMLEPRERK